MTKKVVHIITGLNDGGAEGVLTRLCLHSEQAQHVVISLMDEGKYGPLLSRSGVTVHCLEMNPGKPSIVRFFRLIRVIREEQPDLVQTWMYHADLLGGIAARLAGVRRVFWSIRHSTLEKGKSKRSTIMIARLCAILSGWVPDEIICCANKARYVHKDIGYSARKLSVIPNGYDLSRFRPDCAAGARVRAELGLSANDFIIGNVGRFDPLKDHSNLLQALARVAGCKIPFRCLLIGKGLSPDNTGLIKQIATLGLQDSVLLIGQRSDVPAVMNALDLHVLSSLSEGFPNVLAEAMACGTPCVSTDVGDALDILGDRDACCNARDPKALAEVIIKSAREWQQYPLVWQARKVASSQRISEKFSIEVMVEAYEACWFHSV
ncbi:glycosyltransferase [Marinobacter sp.]|uniref:glycosyltransferase family 4 protein n=1 Tax=Marinobacter sp. TaxID=50741 RepID=UPI000C364C56|nr:glycosyltransferase [Marinobacter sp.]MBE94419.1 glycosyl transferase family 1 [Marinobacter sp.]|tara:strand:- start:2095 stop:3228 length:1134 start_codon:yes stop_codon:yes gene_type:complete